MSFAARDARSKRRPFACSSPAAGRRDGAPLNRQELRERQDRFFAAGQLRIEREIETDREAPACLHPVRQAARGAYLSEPRAYDVLLNYYDQSPPNPQAETVVYQRGCKNTAIRRLLELRPDLLLTV